MSLYTRLQTKADTLIRKYGKVRTVTRWSGTPTSQAANSAYDPQTGSMKPSSSGGVGLASRRFRVSIVTFPYEIRFVNNTTIKQTDLWGMFSAIGLPDMPQPGDKLDMGGVEFTFGTVRPLSPGGVNIYYEVHLTQG